MSNLVVLEGFLRQRVKQKDMVELYVVLTSLYLKIYRSKISYNQHPNDPIRCVDFKDHYNIIDMPFEKTPMFSLFKRGEKADERLYLEASTKGDYDLWFGEIDILINKVIESERVSSTVSDGLDLVKIEADKKKLADIKNLDNVDKSAKVSSPRYNIKATNVLTDAKQVQQTYDKMEAELKNERKTVSDTKQENEQLRRKLLDIEKSNALLQKEKKESLSRVRDQEKKIVELNSSIAKEHELSERQLMKAGQDLGSSLNVTQVDFTSYQTMVDYICQQDNNLPFLHSLLRHQLESLVHKSPLETSSGLSLYKYLTTSIEMSNDFIVKFLSAFLLSLSKQIFSKPSSKRDLSPNLMQLLQSVIEMVPPAQSLCTNKSFQQHSLEIAYLLERMTLEQNLLFNGHMEPVNIEDKFCDLLHSFEIESVNKVLLIELSERMKEACRIKMSKIKLTEKTIADKNVIKERLESTWESLRVQLQDEEQQKNDLLIVINEMSAKNTELEAARTTCDDWRNVDKMVNYYTSLSSTLCDACQVKVVDVLSMPVTSMVDKLVEDFISYWRCVNDLVAFLAKKKTINSDIRDTLDMLKKSAQILATLMSQLQNITQRNISNPGAGE